jgi:hypothetical protein
MACVAAIVLRMLQALTDNALQRALRRLATQALIERSRTSTKNKLLTERNLELPKQAAWLSELSIKLS